MKIGILATGTPPSPLDKAHGSYADMTANWLSQFDAERQDFLAMEGQFPNAPSDADLWIITGSKCAVYEPHPWIAPLLDFIREAHATKSKMIGICFGHQAMATALGGRVEKSPKGWGLGLSAYQPVNWPARLGESFTLTLNAYHQDQVTAPPPGATTIATNDFCPYAGFHYPGFGYSVQAHPEFNAAYMHDLILARRGNSLPIDLVDKALAGLNQPNANAQLAQHIVSSWPEF